MTDTTIHVATILDDVKGIDAEQGQRIYDLVLKAFFQGRKAILSFDSMEVLSEEFLQTAVGQLYENYSHASLKKNMSIEHIPFSGKLILKRVVDRAKVIY